MADLMEKFKASLADLTAKKSVFETASAAVQKASEEYEAAKSETIRLRVEVDKSLDDQLFGVGVSPTDSRVSQSS